MGSVRVRVRLGRGLEDDHGFFDSPLLHQPSTERREVAVFPVLGQKPAGRVGAHTIESVHRRLQALVVDPGAQAVGQGPSQVEGGIERPCAPSRKTLAPVPDQVERRLQRPVTPRSHLVRFVDDPEIRRNADALPASAVHVDDATEDGPVDPAVGQHVVGGLPHRPGGLRSHHDHVGKGPQGQQEVFGSAEGGAVDENGDGARVPALRRRGGDPVLRCGERLGTGTALEPRDHVASRAVGQPSGQRLADRIVAAEAPPQVEHEAAGAVEQGQSFIHRVERGGQVTHRRHSTLSGSPVHALARTGSSI